MTEYVKIELLAYAIVLASQLIIFLFLFFKRSLWGDRLLFSFLIAAFCSVLPKERQFSELFLFELFVYIFSKCIQLYFIVATLKRQSVILIKHKRFIASVISISIISVCLILFILLTKQVDNPVFLIEYVFAYTLVAPILEELQSRVIEFNIIQKKDKGRFILWAIVASSFYSFNHIGHVLNGTSWIYLIIVFFLWLVLYCTRKKYSNDKQIVYYIWIHFFWNFGIVLLNYC